jgi:hypothetical protein
LRDKTIYKVLGKFYIDTIIAKFMTDLIAYISSGKGANAHVVRLIEGETWDKVYILTNDEFRKEVPKRDNIEIILIDSKKTLSELIEEIKKDLKEKIRIMDTAVNIIAGEGKDHMALLSALLQLGVGIRFVALTKEGVKEI